MAQTPRTDLASAYALTGADACLKLYAAWAESYDQTFAAAMQYRLPSHVAAAFLTAGATPGPVLDVGAGTGLCAEALRQQGFTGPIDAVDLSQEMLTAAGAKRLYRNLYCADLTRPLPLAGGYAGMVSSGTFTHGHVGPGCIGSLLDLAMPGAVFAFSVNLSIWDTLGFDAALAQLAGRIAAPQFLDADIYGPAAQSHDPAHAQDRARIMLLRRI